VANNKKKKPARQRPRPLAPRLASTLREAGALMGRKRWAEAAELLEAAEQRSPRQAEVLRLLAQAYFSLRDYRFLQSHPEVGALVPLLLDRGDPGGRELAFRLALITRAPELLTALRDFALSRRGPDRLRMQAAQAASEAGLLPPGPVRMWMRGGWHDILLLGWEIYHEPEDKHSPQVMEWASDAVEAIQAGEGAKAERLLRQALALEPDAPELLNNLAVAVQVQGRTREWEGMIRQIHERFPDYLFGRTNLARLCVREGDLGRAKALLEPLLKQRRFHVTEFTALAVAEVDLHLAHGEVEGARSWVEMLERGDPDNPQLPLLRSLLQKRGWRGWLGG
jgi:tetratricopeptide (TPR) repeat protein